MNELEQAEARLDEWMDVVAERFTSGEGPHELIALVSAAIEVGRLRERAALNLLTSAVQNAMDTCAMGPRPGKETYADVLNRVWDVLRTGLAAAREEVQG